MGFSTSHEVERVRAPHHTLWVPFEFPALLLYIKALYFAWSHMDGNEGTGKDGTVSVTDRVHILKYQNKGTKQYGVMDGAHTQKGKARTLGPGHYDCYERSICILDIKAL